MASQEDATIDLMLFEAIKTSAIEGEVLDRESVRSFLLSLITSDTLPDNSDRKAVGLLRCWWTFVRTSKHR